MKTLHRPASRRATALAIATLFLAGASHALAAPRLENAYLSQADAAARSARVSNVDYVLDFVLTGKESFSATTSMQFDLKDTAEPLTIDLDKANLGAVSVNGKTIAPRYNQWFITVPADALRVGRNAVSISYTRAHSTNGEGLHRMVDPVDQRVYLYSHFEPAAAHQMFALFDQPDLKASYQINVTAPADWVVVSAARETTVKPADGGRHWVFPKSKKLSPYNFSLHAGPYKVWEDNSGKYPQRLFARQSVAAQVQPEEWFRLTAKGLAFFDNYFGIPYQFEKYDQLLVPDFLYGAMENAGAVTFGEHAFLHKDKMTTSQRHSLASVIMHEMAHQWFGDLVTMEWWNGLWLNESFASFMGTLATTEATEFTNGWQNFYSSGKARAYEQDQRVSTHPIEVPVPSSANAFDNIDAITYAKGASTLKQLRHLLGEETFRKGVHNYLVKYAWKNAKLDDFIGSLGEAAGRDLGQWTQEWLYQSGVNGISALYECKAGKVASFSLAQSASPDMNVLREQRVQIALMRLAGKQLKLDRKLAVTYKGASTEVPGLKGAPCPDLVYPNYQDWGYAKVKLDPRSFATTRASLSKVDDPLLRSMLWNSLWDGVKDAELPLNDFLATAMANVAGEQDYVLLGDSLTKIADAKTYLERMAPESAYTRDSGKALEKMAWDALQSSKGDSNFKRRWLDFYRSFASSKEGLDRLAAILDGSLKVDQVNVNQDLRWAIIQQLNRRDYPGSASLIEAELLRDKSDSGQLAALAATVGRPDPAVKAEWLAQSMNLQTKLQFSRIREAMNNLYPAAQGALSEQSAAQRLAQLPALDKAAGPVYMRAYAGSMLPASCTAASVARLAKAASEQKDLSAGTRRALLVAHQEDARCVKIRGAMTVALD